MADEKVKREPVNYLWTALNWDFLRLLAEIAQYAAGKYGSAEQYKNARLEGEKSPINHAIEHLTRYMAGEKHDRFGTLDHQLAAAAYNISMEYFDLKVRGFRGFVLLAMQRAAEVAPVFETMAAKANEVEVSALANVAAAATAEWAEGLTHFATRWQDGLAGARDPGAIRRWTAMLDVISQFVAVDVSSDAVVFAALDDIVRDAKEMLFAEKTPENIETQQAKIAACETIRGRVPEMFPKKGGG